jgi:hypothetical protein
MKMSWFILLLASMSLGVWGEGTRWPLHLISDGSQITVYQPQADLLKDGVLAARSGLAVTPAGQTNSVFGVMRLEARIVSDTDLKMVSLKNIHVSDVSLSDLSHEQEVQIAARLAIHAFTWNLTFSEDALYAMLELAGATQAESLEARVPHTASVSRGSQLDVVYEGQPRFEPIEQTSLQYAVNTPFQVIQDGTSYYCADRGVWYAAYHPHGPWKATERISSKIRTIPPSSPLYNTRFLYVGDQSEDEIYYGYYPGYVNGATHRSRLTGWGVNYESPDYSIQVDPRRGGITYREKSTVHPQRKTKNWGRDTTKFPEFE